MKKSFMTAALAALVPLFAGPPAMAQDDGPAFRPVEMWACKFKDRKDQDDLDRVYELEAQVSGGGGYSAWHLSPYMVGDRVEQFDFIYLGAWADGTTMGAGLAQYMANGQAAENAWDATLDCLGSMYASTRIQAVPAASGDGSGGFVMTISDCKVAHGSTAGQAIGALTRFNDYRVANGSTVPTFAWFPVYGGGGAEFDFKLAHAYTDVEALGNEFSWYVDHQAYNTYNQITQGVVDCDEARLYMGRTIVSGMN